MESKHYETPETQGQELSTVCPLPPQALTPQGLAEPLPPETLPGRVTAVHRERYQVAVAGGECYARLKASAYYGGSEEFPTVGDYVLLRAGEGEALLLRTLPRRTVFERPDPDVGKAIQAVAANFDTVWICMSCNQNFNPARLERYAAASWQTGAVPIVLLTKCDLAENPEDYVARAQAAAPGIDVLALSAQTGQGMEALEPYLKPGQAAVLLGSSGVGKSSLVNALLGEEHMKVSAVREEDGRGRHTTTHRQMICLPGGALLMDTPGMRSLGLLDAEEGVEAVFADIEALAGRCRFSDCTHTAEPGCAVKAALADGTLEPKRWESYQKLDRTARFMAGKIDYLRARTKLRKTAAPHRGRKG